MESNNNNHIIKYSRKSIQGNINMLYVFVNRFFKKTTENVFLFLCVICTIMLYH